MTFLLQIVRRDSKTIWISDIKYSTVIKCFIYTKQYTVYSLVQIYSSWSDSPPDGSRVELLEHEIEQSIWNPDRYFNEVV